MIKKLILKQLGYITRLARASVVEVSKLPNTGHARQPFRQRCAELYEATTKLFLSDRELAIVPIKPPTNSNSSYTLEGDLRVISTYLDEVETFFVDQSKPTDNIVLPDGHAFTAHNAIKRILETATVSIKVIDNYMSEDSISMFESGVNRRVGLQIITTDKNKTTFQLFIKASRIFKKARKDTELGIHLSNKFHDRFIIIDDSQVWHSGPSIDKLGIGTVGVISELSDAGCVKLIVELFDSEWKNTKPFSIETTNLPKI